MNIPSSPNFYSPKQPPISTRPRVSVVQSDAPRVSHGGNSPKPISYQHARVIGIFLLACVFVVVLQDVTLLQTTLVLGLFLYSLDLANARVSFLYALAISALVLSLMQGYLDMERESSVWLAFSSTIISLILWTSVSGCLSLSMEWFASSSSTAKRPSGNRDRLSAARHIESLLHGWVPPVTAAIMTISLQNMEGLGQDAAALLGPHVFAVVLAASMFWVGSCPSSFVGHSKKQNTAVNSIDSQGSSSLQDAYCIDSRMAWMHVALLLIGPIVMHLTTCLWRILSSYASSDDFYDFLLVITVPVLLCFGLCGLDKTPYSQLVLTVQSHTAVFFPVMLTLVASFSLQQRYLLSMSMSLSNRFMGSSQPVWLSTFYWLSGTVFALMAFWLWGRRKTSDPQQPLLGEYQEDVVQLSLALSGAAFGKAFGLPWNFVPLPILAFLGLTLWIATRMLRYLSIFLFVFHATGIVVFTYRFAGIQNDIETPLPGVQLTLIRFGFVVVFCSILGGLVAGLAVRSSGGIASGLLRRIDATGILLVAYSLMLMLLEITLIKRPVPTNELNGFELDADTAQEDESVYDHSMAILTSGILIGLAAFMMKVKIISPRTAWVAMSISVGKAVSVYIDADRPEDSGLNVFMRSIIAAILCVVMLAPRVFLEPVHVKTFSRRRSKTSGRADTVLPPGTMGRMLVYALFFLPVSLCVAIPYVLFPLADVFADHYGDDNPYATSSPIPELVGSAVALWGLGCLSTLNYYLPDAGGEALKKLSALVFLVGVGIFFTAPILGSDISAASNPYASMSILGSQLIKRARSRTGVWGLLSAALATLLAVGGPLELKERRGPRAKTDRFLLFRTMIFSLLFGGGVSWFVVMLSMREAELSSLIVVMLLCLLNAFIGTIAAVFGYYLNLEEFGEVKQVVQVWLVFTAAGLPFGYVSTFLSLSDSPSVGAGGWLSTYQAVCCLSSLTVSVCVRNRSTKNAATSAIGNMMCVLSWLFAVSLLYGRYGVAGLDANYEIRSVGSIPVPVLGTLVVAPILLALEGEANAQRRSAIKRLSTTAKANRPTGLDRGLTLPHLHRCNRWFPLFFGSVSVFLLAALYVILLRGSGISSTVSTTHADLMSNMIGKSGDLAALAKMAISRSKVLAASAKLAGSGFWTGGGFVGPLLHLLGVASTLPSLYFLYSWSWLQQPVPTAQVTLVLPLHAIPLLLCRGIPSLTAAAVLTLVGGIVQAMNSRKAEFESRMRI